MPQGLFRKEVLEARRTGWLGRISLAQPLNGWLMTGVAGIVALAVVMFLCMGTYTRRSSVTGQLVPSKGLATVLAPATGVVSHMEVPEGGKVRAGQMLALVTVPRTTQGGGDTTAALELRLRQRRDGLAQAQAAQQEQLVVQADSLRRQLEVARKELGQIDREVTTRQAQVRIYESIVARMRELQADKYVSPLEIEQQQSAMLEYTSEMQTLQRQAFSTRRTIAQLEQTLQELPEQRRSAKATYQRELAQLEQEQVENEARGALAVTASVDGIVATQVVKPGQAVQSGQVLLSLLPANGQLEAELLVPSRAVGFIEKGDEVWLRYQAFPYQKFGHHLGWVSAVSRSALTSGELGVSLGETQQSEPFYRVTVALAAQAVTAYGNRELLKPGMLLDADIQGERRTLVEWIFEPLFSIGGRVR